MRMDIGIIEHSNRFILKNYTCQLCLNPSNAITVNEISTIMINKTLVNQLISRSNLPIFIRGLEVFIDILVSLPVKITIPTTNPEEASTVFCQRVFSNERPI